MSLSMSRRRLGAGALSGRRRGSSTAVPGLCCSLPSPDRSLPSTISLLSSPSMEGLLRRRRGLARAIEVAALVLGEDWDCLTVGARASACVG